ncbi:hypothetical protein PHYPO_G00172850 [Pangasianodon hypophthalmus]|uniref:Uncharacterized protein n=1 Tax=Pangasianodon hypophthalmus TaxID=310915 RepID=A0A5N5JF42_PANHP|nr:hypothetical protein PHYPO_G00172850 [Pangasianodon hypophthalmus]
MNFEGLDPVSMTSCTGLAHCKVALAFAVIFDLVGVMVLLAGVFVPLERQHRRPDFKQGDGPHWQCSGPHCAHAQPQNAHPPRPSGSLKQIAEILSKPHRFHDKSESCDYATHPNQAVQELYIIQLLGVNVT